MQTARPPNLIEIAPDLGHTIADQPAVGLNLRFARTAQKPETAALAFQVGPTAHQSPGLIIEMGEFDLHPPLGGRGTLAKDFEDQPGAVDHLALELFLKVALLHRGQRAVDDDQFGLMQFARGGDILDLAFAKQRRRSRIADRHGIGVGDHDPDRQCQPPRLFDARIGVRTARPPAKFRAHDHRPDTPGHFTHFIVGKTQDSDPSSPSHSPVKSTGVSGWIVETACL